MTSNLENPPLDDVQKDLPRLFRDMAYAEGFDAVGFVSPDAIPEAATRLNEFISAGRHGDMDWMETHQKRREAPLNLWSDVKTIIMLGMNYGPDINPLDALEAKEKGVISVYARGHDYHDVIKKKLKKLARRLVEETGGAVKVFVDTAPIMEKPLAEAAGLGWQGKHTNLVSRSFGSWLFLGSIFTTSDLPKDEPEIDHCGSCSSCLDICPTDAFPAPYKLDARRCISYLTIEAKSQIPHAFRSKMGNHIYGCDDCLAVCPWNKYAAISREAKLQARAELTAPDLLELVDLDDTTFRALFRASPVKRTGRDRFVRNVLIAIGNAAGAVTPSQQSQYLTAIESRLIDTSPLVQGMAVWALGQYLSDSEMKIRAASALSDEAAGQEMDDTVRVEWEFWL
ncbi:iron-sulfur cluster-binding protein [alpha proteobacterium IMCC14465]|uniref:Epoxyqueuosine reductase n=1 Tax=alpha proteobacterium IMCC14465 TaxID=1220535 RepID=J9DGB3_9PROT|nr:iron-sulfur cluster-binding protein [alpha proteobacterium IMCC14465]